MIDVFIIFITNKQEGPPSEILKQKMEFTCFYYHSNYNAYSITFINNKKNMYQVILQLIRYDFNIEEEFEVSFVITEDELKNTKNLYKMYVLSCMMTKDKNALVYDYRIERWVIEGIKYWKAMYFTKHNSLLYGFNEYPAEILLSPNNEEIKNFYINFIETDTGLIYNRCHLKVADTYISAKINEYSSVLNDIENKVYTCKKYNLFFNKTIGKNIVLKDDVKKIIYKKLMDMV